MAIINPEGLFNGDRLRRCSNLAQLHWPRLFLASDGFGRLEINYARIVGTAYGSFTPAPTREELKNLINEYRANFLLFVYLVQGQPWGQWDTKAEYLPRYKRSSDKRSPAPPEDHFTKWKQQYASEKMSFTKSFGELCEDLPLGIGDGVGVGVGIGIGKDFPSPAAPDEAEIETQLAENAPNESGRRVSRKPSAASLDDLSRKWFSEEFWPAYWRKVDRADALKAFQKHATSEAKKNQIVQAVIAHAPVYERRNPEHRPHAATWLNKMRYEEPPEDLNASPNRSRSVMEGV